MEILCNGFTISDDKARLQPERIRELLSDTYWAKGRSLETVEKTIQNSLCFGVYREGLQVGFARCVTDYATIYWLADVVIDPAYRGHGLGVSLMSAVTEHPQLCSITGILATDDAHGLYARYGFVSEDGRFMRRRPETAGN